MLYVIFIALNSQMVTANNTHFLQLCWQISHLLILIIISITR